MKNHFLIVPVLLLSLMASSLGFTTRLERQKTLVWSRAASSRSFSLRATKRPCCNDVLEQKKGRNPNAGHLITAAALAGVLATSPMPSQAYDANDYASETVQAAVQSLKDASGNIEQTFKEFKNVADIITEGKGVGGTINFKGVQLERGYVADEDTSIYNPGLTLLTESEKERLVEAVVGARKAGLQTSQWNENNELAFDFLREKLDPYHMNELKGYLRIVPIYAAVVYLAVLAVQQVARDLFPVAYFVGVAAIFVPALILIALGPQ